MDSPGYHVSGVSIPGTPVVLIGHNQHISWSLTDAQNQQTFFYLEHEDSAHPGQYFWKGAWKSYSTVSYDIPVLGGPTDHLTVKLSVHGPVITERGQTTSVWWAGNIPSQDLDVLLGIDQASNYQRVPRRAARLVLADPQLRLRGRPGQHRPDLGGLLPAGRRGPAVAADARDRRGRRHRHHPVRLHPAGVQPA